MILAVCRMPFVLKFLIVRFMYDIVRFTYDSTCKCLESQAIGVGMDSLISESTV